MGNLINKDWSQQIDNNSSDETQNSDEFKESTYKQKSSNVLRRKLSNLVNSTVCDQSIEYFRVNSIDSPGGTPTTNKFTSIDFDPRSPSSGIIR